MVRSCLVLALIVLVSTPAVAKDRVLSWDDGTKAGQRSSSGTGHVIEFAAPKGRWWVKAVRIFGARYGGGYDPATTPFTVAVGDASTEAKYDLFRMGRFEWVEVPLDEAVQVSKTFRVCVAFAPARTRGVFVGIAKAAKSHSFLGLPGGTVRPAGEEVEWMIRAVLTSRKPKRPAKKKPPDRSGDYRKDFAFIEKTVARRFPALEKKGVDWKAVCADWRPRFPATKDDREHLRNVHRLLATLGDSHTGVTTSKAGEHVPSFDGLYGAGMWIAVEGDRLILRALVRGHLLAKKVPPGSELIEIDGRPAGDVHEEVRARLRTWHGWSSTHFLDARLSFQFFPFGSKRTMSATFRTPDRKVAAVTLPRWGPGGRGLSRPAVTMPESVAMAGKAVSGDLGDGISYVRILGGMSEATRVAFFDAMDHREGARGIILDCRGMGGGGDTPAWAMAGRFFSTLVPHGHVSLRPTGRWQFRGPVVMLIDERMISSAETFAWAMTETGRVVTVGRPTGGATIIPTSFEAPSGLFAFRMGVTDRKTPGKGVRPEGIGTAPDVYVPYTARSLAGGRDPTLEVAREVLGRLLAGDSRKKAIAAGERTVERIR